MSTRVKIWIFDNDGIRLASLEAAFADFRQASFFKFEKLPEVLHARGLDAVYLSPPYAERWGARPIFERAEILRTSPADRAGGMVPFVLSGILFKPDDVREPSSRLRLFMDSALEAAASFNRENPGAIRSVGFLGQNIAFDPLRPEEVASIVRRAYEEKLSET